MEKRYHQRISAGNLFADVSDGWGFFSGTVQDLSRKGLLLNNMPKKLDNRAKQVSIVISDGGKSFKILGRPRWSKAKSISQAVGVEILKAPLGWTEFVMSKEQPAEQGWNEILI